MEISNQNQTIQNHIQWNISSHLLKLVTNILLPSSLLSVLLSYPLFCNSRTLAYGLQVFSFCVGKNYMFLLCNGLLIFIATTSGLIRSYGVDGLTGKGVGPRELEIESSEPKGSILKAKVTAKVDQTEYLHLVVQDEEERSNELVPVEEDEDEELGLLSKQELNKKCEDFIRKMKEGIQFEAGFGPPQFPNIHAVKPSDLFTNHFRQLHG